MATGKFGSGKITLPNGDEIQADFKALLDSDPEGKKAIIVFDNHDMYSGDACISPSSDSFSFVLGGEVTMEGVGKMSFSNGAFYIGDFKTNRFDGEGQYIYPKDQG